MVLDVTDDLGPVLVVFAQIDLGDRSAIASLGCDSRNNRLGIELDLRNAELATEPVVLNAFAMFGGIEIKVPTEWVVQRDTIGIFGGTDDGRKNRP